MTYRHIVLFRVHDDVDDDRVTEAVDRLRSLGALPGILSWQVEPSLDTRKGRVIVEDSTFADAAAFEAFRENPQHTEIAAEMAQISDWWIGDYPGGRNYREDSTGWPGGRSDRWEEDARPTGPIAPT